MQQKEPIKSISANKEVVLSAPDKFVFLDIAHVEFYSFVQFEKFDKSAFFVVTFLPGVGVNIGASCRLAFTRTDFAAPGGGSEKTCVGALLDGWKNGTVCPASETNESVVPSFRQNWLSSLKTCWQFGHFFIIFPLNI